MQLKILKNTLVQEKATKLYLPDYALQITNIILNILGTSLTVFLLCHCSNKHYLCISAPAMPLPPLEPMPGPGHYNVVDYEGPPKHYMSSSAFVSTTSRWTGGVLGEEDSPGPGMLHIREQ